MRGVSIPLPLPPIDSLEWRDHTPLDPGQAQAYTNLGRALQGQGQFAEALCCLRRGHELGVRQPGWRLPSGEWVRECLRQLELQDRLPDLLAGRMAPGSAAERLEVTRLCVLTRQYAAAARFFTDAFAAEPKLADDLGAGHRYDAACAAALVAAGQARDAAELDDKQRADLRRQALDWLRGDLRAWTMVLDKGPPQARPFIQQRLQHWQQDRDLASLRDREALNRLPEAEREAWGQLWADVAELLKRAQQKPER